MWAKPFASLKRGNDVHPAILFSGNANQTSTSGQDVLGRWLTVYVDRVMYVREVVDTAAIIADYELKRSYVIPLFDNQYGKLDLSLSAQYNRLGVLSYEFMPVTKVVYREKTWRPFACLTYGSLGYVGGGAGIFDKSTGISIQYQTDFKKNGFGISVVKTV
jgi:hypothetical protein